KEQRAKMTAQQRAEGGDGATASSAGEEAPQPHGSEETITFEGGGDFGEEEEPNFNREDANRETVHAGSDRPDRPRGGGRHGGGGGGGGRRHGRGGGRGRGPRGGGGGDRGGSRGGSNH